MDIGVSWCSREVCFSIVSMRLSWCLMENVDACWCSVLVEGVRVLVGA